MKRSFALVLLLAALAARSPAVHAGAPAVPEYSTVDSALIICPAGDLPFVAIARILPDILAFRTFTILVDVTDCPGFVLGTLPPSPELAQVQYGGRTYLEQYCSPGGYAEFRIPGGGVAAGLTIPVIETTHGVVLRTRSTMLSPDQNGDLIVDLADVALATAKLGGSDPTADFDFDGAVTSADLAMLQAHLGHADIALRPTAIARATWGGIKQLYRDVR